MDYSKLALIIVKKLDRLSVIEVGTPFNDRHIEVIEELRDEDSGLSINQIGTNICIDWNPDEHTQWLEGIITALKKDHLIQTSGAKLVLVD